MSDLKILKKRYKQISSKKISLASKIKEVFKGFEKEFNLDLLYSVFNKETKTTLRGRVYRELMTNGTVVRVDEGIYRFNINDEDKGLILNSDARDLSNINNESISLIMADHPYSISQGGNRSFNSSYKESSFEYNQKDFDEKSRVLVEGGFCVEFLPELKESNWKYLNSILTMAEKAGLNLYAKVPWYKAEIKNGHLVDRSANVGRKSVLEDVYIFSKGEPRKLRFKKRGKVIQNQRGASQLLPALFMKLCEIPSKRNHKAEKPIELLEKIIKMLSLPKETVLDQFAGSFNTFIACLNTNRKVISIELNKVFIDQFLLRYQNT